MFANDIGIDLGTATTLIYIAVKGIVLREPSIVAMDERNGQVLAVGDEAYTMLGKTASDIRVVRPLEDGVISDYEVTEQMLKHFFAKVNPSRVFKPRVCVCVPSAIIEVESRSVIDTVMSSGARNVYLIEEPVAAAIGAVVGVVGCQLFGAGLSGRVQLGAADGQRSDAIGCALVVDEAQQLGAIGSCSVCGHCHDHHQAEHCSAQEQVLQDVFRSVTHRITLF